MSGDAMCDDAMNDDAMSDDPIVPHLACRPQELRHAGAGPLADDTIREGVSSATNVEPQEPTLLSVL
jgi:hypothetical protein